MINIQKALIFVVVGSMVLGVTLTFGAMQPGVFQGFLGHINQQIVLDKEKFVAAEICTQWFYKQLKKRPPRPLVQGVSLKFSVHATSADELEETCLRQYPKGLDDARVAFSKTQSELSLSLTYFQLALVGDRDDDGEYSTREIQDVFESFGMVFHQGGTPLQHLTTLNHHFDTIRESVNFSMLTDGMQVLFQKGYRLTQADQAALQRVTG
jgi:hypothetical protein